jgi:hypothetical protein
VTAPQRTVLGPHRWRSPPRCNRALREKNPGRGGDLGRSDSGQFWVRTRERRERKLLSLGGRKAKSPKQVAHRLLTHPEAPGDLAPRHALAVPALHQRSASIGQAGPPPRVAPGTPERRKTLGLEASLASPHRSLRIPKGACDLVLPRPSLIGQADHGVRLADPIPRGVVREHEPAHAYYTVAVLLLEAAASVDDHPARRPPPVKQLSLPPVFDHPR